MKFLLREGYKSISEMGIRRRLQVARDDTPFSHARFDCKQSRP